MQVPAYRIYYPIRRSVHYRCPRHSIPIKRLSHWLYSVSSTPYWPGCEWSSPQCGRGCQQTPVISKLSVGRHTKSDGAIMQAHDLMMRLISLIQDAPATRPASHCPPHRAPYPPSLTSPLGWGWDQSDPCPTLTRYLRRNWCSTTTICLHFHPVSFVATELEPQCIN